ncbi:unnamed protein product [Microthlaspi erraticum]|uniref:RING-type E3 ubiquitin transferase n=1 Tax=Microthlaspi erraticum TaxID=1685480 RepID=A0A6D2IJK1_9BRAS|nr:unnamed protein product [Microthlaspi erraticum]
MVIMSRLTFYSSFLLLLRLVAAQSSASDQGSGFNPTTAAIVLILLVSVFSIIGCVVIFKRRWIEQALGRCLEHALGISHDQALEISHEQDVGLNDSRRRSGDSGNWLNVRSTPSRGIDASVIETFPTFRYSAVTTLKIGKEVLGCSVCLNDFEDDETLRLIPQCCHVFHPGCIDGWLVSQDTCPLCRANLVPVPGESVFYELPGSARETGPNSPGTSIDDNRRRFLGSPDERLISSMARKQSTTPRKSMSTGRLLTGFLSRIDWTGRPRENLDRFTLKLPRDVHDQLVSQGSKGHVALPHVRSPIVGYRTESLGTEKNYFYGERLDQERRFDRRPFSITPPFWTGSRRTSAGNSQELASPPISLLLAMKSPFDWFFSGKNNAGERSHLRSSSDASLA